MSSPEQEIVLPPIEFTAGGPTEEIRIANLEAVKPSPGYPEVAILIADGIVKRTDIIVLDYTAQAVAIRYQIDGIWHNLPPRDRVSGDYILATLKKLANLNYQDRRSRQEGEFEAKFRFKKTGLHLTTQGIQTGERVAIRFDREKPPLETLTDLGMRPKMQEALGAHLAAQSGLILVSSLPGDGFSTAWRGVLHASDRLMRDYLVFESANNREPEVINVTPAVYDLAAGQTPLDLLPEILLKEPDVLCFTELINAEVINRMCDLVLDQNLLVFARVHAKSAAEALLRVLVHRCDLKKFAQAIRCVVNCRLVRRLCENCKQPYVPPPQFLQQLGIRPGRVEAFYTHYQAQQGVDENGNPVEPQVCQVCENMGFHERTGIFELLDMNDHMRETLLATPQLENLTAMAKQTGQIPLRDEGIVMLAKGTTSIEELQRVLKK